MNTLRNLIRLIGIGTLLAVLLTPVIAAGALAAITPRLIAANHQATARVDLAPIIGTRASYEVSSFVADFGSAYLGANPGSEGAGLGPYIDMQRQGNSSSVIVSYTATTKQGAEDGLRAATEKALKQVAESQFNRATLEQKSAHEMLEQTLKQPPTAAPDGQVPDSARTASRDAMVQQTTLNAASADLRLATAETALAQVAKTVDGLPIEVTELSSAAQQFRVIAAGALSALVIALVVAALLYRRQSRRQGSAELDGENDDTPVAALGRQAPVGETAGRS